MDGVTSRAQIEAPPKNAPVIQLRAGAVTLDPKLDRIQDFDPRSLNYPASALYATAKPLAQKVIPSPVITWACDMVLHQYQTPRCVGFSITHELRMMPKIENVGLTTAIRIYTRAQYLDPWPGQNYPGTSLLAGMKAAQEMGYFPKYRWAFGADDLALAIQKLGPAVIGIDWYSQMYYPSLTKGRYVIKKAGYLVGGHAIVVSGYDPNTQQFELLNSWGPYWGLKGRVWISHHDMALLLSQDGEAVIPTLR